MLGLVKTALQRVRDTFAAGAAERRFRALEADCRELMFEFDEVLTKAARRAATEARAKKREIAREQPAEVAATAPTRPASRAEWKAQMRAGLAARRNPRLIQPPPSDEPPPEESVAL